MSDEREIQPRAESAPEDMQPGGASDGSASRQTDASPATEEVAPPLVLDAPGGPGADAPVAPATAAGREERSPPPVLARPALMFVAGAVSLALVLAMQHLRHGWPFSLHHGVVDTSSEAAEAPPHGGGETGHRRVAVEVEEARLDALGVATTTVGREDLAGELRAVATVVPDESRVSHVHTRVSGWVERLSVTTTGEAVRSGEVLGAIFSRELLASQTEFITALRAGSDGPLARGARDRLRVLGMTDGEIEALERRGSALRNVPIVSPRAGVVLHRGVTRGAAVDPSTELFVIADLSTVWVLAEVPESRMTEVALGSTATLELASSGVEAREATVAFVYPTLTESTRTLRVRFVVENPDGEIRPGAFGTAVFHLAPRTALVVPRDAIVDHGTSQYVFVATGGGRFEPREVSLGARFDERVEVLDGVTEGERVVSSGVFLLDSESRLRASGGMTGHGHGGSTPEPTSDDEAARSGGPSPERRGHTAHEAP